MRNLRSDTQLQSLADRVRSYAVDDLGMTLPELRFFILSPLEFASLLEKQVYPTSPVNIWEGKRMVNKKHRIESGQESALYYEVVQTGDPSYAYLNETNSVMTQASVMAHVTGHCEFSELNVLHDSDQHRTEYILYLVKKVELARTQMGEQHYLDYWNACESAVPFIAPNSQYRLANSIETDYQLTDPGAHALEQDEPEPSLQPISDSLQAFLKQTDSPTKAIEAKRERRETLSRQGYRLRAPCQDVTGFLRHYAPSSHAERTILDYLYESHKHQDFVGRTQIMNEGWAMYWEKKIMLQLFGEKAVKGIIDYAKVFSGVCFPRPFFNRNPYHLGYHLWQHIEVLYRKGRVCEAYEQETDQVTKDAWSKTGEDPIAKMRHLVRTLTDYEFLRRFLTPQLVEEFHLNRVSRQQAESMGIERNAITRADKHWVWIDAESVKTQMLLIFTHFYRPRIYVIDNQFLDGGLLLYHRDDGMGLRKDWIQPTLHNLKRIWKAPVYLMSQKSLFGYTAKGYHEKQISPIGFEEVRERMQKSVKPYVWR